MTEVPSLLHLTVDGTKRGGTNTTHSHLRVEEHTKTTVTLTHTLRITADGFDGTIQSNDDLPPPPRQVGIYDDGDGTETTNFLLDETGPPLTS